MNATLNMPRYQSTDWMRELDFYLQEISILTDRLATITSPQAGKELMARIEHFKNKFTALRSRIDGLDHDIKTCEINPGNEGEETPEKIEEHLKLMNDRLFDRMIALSNSLAITQYDFNQFLSKI